MTEIKCLDHGFVRLVDRMGDDSAIVQSARVSYGTGTKKISEDRGLIRYLLRNHHCYHPSMEVLTNKGWMRWDELGEKAVFVIPNPETGKYTYEDLEVKVFDYDNELYGFHNQRMSYLVTSEHSMYFRPKYQENYSKFKVNEMPLWGHFKPVTGLKVINSDVGDSVTKTPIYQFLGFYLGDGSVNSGTICFHLKKKRKIDYLLGLLNRLSLQYTMSPIEGGTYKFYIHKPKWFNLFIDDNLKSKDKKLSMPGYFGYAEAYGLFDGLVNSDGHSRTDRPQIQFSSSSEHLLELFEYVCALIGYASKRTHDNVVTTYTDKTRTTLESRKNYHYKEHYTGNVYCATSSTGWLMVRGDNKSLGFVCGNTTPFEMCEIKFHIKLPIFVARQWIRHRTANVNEYSARYSILDKEFYIPDTDYLLESGAQSKTNKQGAEGGLNKTSVDNFLYGLDEHCEQAYNLYEDANEKGIAREISRMALPLNYYTQWYWKIDLHNLLHFLRLRIDPHAQYEIRVFANAMAEIVKEWVPLTWEAFEDYRLYANDFSRHEMEGLKLLFSSIHLDEDAVLQNQELLKRWAESKENRGEMSKRESKEFLSKLGLEG